MLLVLIDIFCSLVNFIVKVIVFTAATILALLVLILALGPKDHEMCKTETRVHDYSKDTNRKCRCSNDSHPFSSKR